MSLLMKTPATAQDIHPVPKLPSGTHAAPPATCLVVMFVLICSKWLFVPDSGLSASNHISDYVRSANQGLHLSVYVCTESNWERDPHEYGAAVHIFSVEGNPAKGYERYLIFSGKKQKFNSRAIKEALARAKAKNIRTGRLGIEQDPSSS